jgi:hypothetical protein
MDIKYKIVSIDEETNSILIKSAPADSVVNIDEYPAIGYSLSAIDFSQNIEQQIISLVEPNTVELSVKQQQKDNALDVLKEMIGQENSGVTVPPAPIEQLLVTDDMLQRFMDTYDRAKSGVEE